MVGLVSFFRFVGSRLLRFAGKLLLASFGSSSPVFKAIDTTFGVDDFFFTSEERVRRTGNMDFYERVLVTIFPFDCLGGLRG